ncbi:MAG: hypothetical protein KAS96_09425, partial [Planctomycetes bacterium]|nr:hypothetical protein [Planctomycetota bacterium]
ALEIPRKNAAWLAPVNLANASDPNETVAQKSGFDLTIVRVGIKAVAFRRSSTFTPSQVRLICKPKQAIDDPLGGKGITIYPEGFMKNDKLFYISRLGEKITVARKDMKGNTRWYDFGFYIPKGYLPVLVEFKRNALARIKPEISPSQVFEDLENAESGDNNNTEL